MDFTPYFLFGGLGIFFLIYNNLGKRREAFYWESPLDRFIPFVPAFIVPYLFYFPFTFATFVFVHESLFEVKFLASMNLSLFLSLVVYYFIPSSIHRPALPEEKKRDIFELMMALVYRTDQTTNGFPSAHVFVSVICGYYLTLAFPHLVLLIWTVAGGIIASTALVKQHYVIDIVGGILWGLGAIAIVSAVF